MRFDQVLDLLCEKDNQINDLHTFLTNVPDSVSPAQIRIFIKGHMNGKEIGSGAFATVYRGKDGGSNIVKIAEDDPYYTEYAHMVYKGKMWLQNDTFPRIDMIHSYNNGNLTVVVMEELATDYEKIADLMGHGNLRYLVSMNLVNRAIGSRRADMASSESTTLDMVDATDNFLKKIDQTGGPGTSDRLYQNIRFVYNEFHQVDLHPGNLGLRDGKNIVFFDPVSS